MDFVAGDYVRLNSGSPIMTVEKVCICNRWEPEGRAVICRWPNGKGAFISACFQPVCLMKHIDYAND